MIRVLIAVRHRAPLPEPDGLVTNTGEPRSQSQADAKGQVELVNRRTKQIRDTIFSKSKQLQGEDIVQHGLLHEPKPDEVSTKNRSTDQK